MTIEVFRFEVEQHGNARAQAVHVLELEARQLADDPCVLFERTVEARQRPADVAGDGDRRARRAEHRAQQLSGRRLAVRSCDPDDRVSKQAEAELDLAPDRNPARTRSRCERRLPGHARALDEQLDVVQQAFLLSPEVDFDACLGKPPGVEVLRTIDADGGDAAAGESQGSRLTGAGESQDERPAWEFHGLCAVTESRPSADATVTPANPESLKSRSISRGSKFNAGPFGSWSLLETSTRPPFRRTRKNSAGPHSLGASRLRTASTLPSVSGRTSATPTR